MTVMDSFEAKQVGLDDSVLLEKLKEFNKNFAKEIAVSKGYYDIPNTIEDKGWVEREIPLSDNHTVKAIYDQGKLVMSEEKIGDYVRRSAFYDQNGEAGMTTLSNKSGFINLIYKPNAKMGFLNDKIAVVTDAKSRPVFAKILDVKLDEAATDSISNSRTKDYRPNDDSGHLIARRFSGTADEKNIVAMDSSVNRGSYKKFENLVAKLVEEGHEVDYSIHVNYVGTSTLPTSFETEIISDGKKYEGIPDDLKKIYNNAEPEGKFGKLANGVKHKLTDMGEVATATHEINKTNALFAAGITAVMSAVDNVSDFLAGNIDGQEATKNVAKEVAASSVTAYSVGVISTNIEAAMAKSSVSLLSKLGHTIFPVSSAVFLVDSYDSVASLAKGEIDLKECVYDLGESATSVGGSIIVGGAGQQIGSVIGGFIGSAAGPGGTAVGSIAGGTLGSIGGCLLGCVVSSEIYETAVNLGVQGAGKVADMAQGFAAKTVELVTENIPDKVMEVKDELSKYFADNDLPMQI